MKITNIKELLAAASSKEGLSEASVSEFITTQLEAKMTEWETTQNEKANAIKNATDKASQLETELSKANVKIQEVTVALEKLSSEMSAKKKEEDFQTRMSAIASEYELSAKESELVAKQIKVLDETSYASWFENFSVFAEAKSKKSIAAAKEVADAKLEEAKKTAAVSTAAVTTTTAQVSKASEETTKAEVATAALDLAVEAPNQSVANTTVVTTAVDGKKEWASAFGGDNLKVIL